MKVKLVLVNILFLATSLLARVKILRKDVTCVSSDFSQRESNFHARNISNLEPKDCILELQFFMDKYDFEYLL